ncbi:putative isomerase [Parabacteroides sp. PF5-5]|uniref:MGH1-like glycoside hydrolase domain-containing protein n=1 Tax=unclassified Parabacteroides TaxID=2649774 RepID=UPI0024762DCD|nr:MULTISPECIES: trehalase family glycosidase [unclassified Parabacteroides]MDH6305392.1 putative isomerase [Parabacteroides sp. PH5-39]MDH6316102.1 putative isomerase [Parabacteroides sp. PF5-13]MDH6320252.1 putative isomerase [Parabacteroides sp. PH5-13]MDH6323982.1 putative isomerase [Parabacteroides sp. PH5-8]MDH6327293.1 putative isomerase [Parabacteroides sp. PH5-41]
MKHTFKLFILFCLGLVTACQITQQTPNRKAYEFDNILDISYTPDKQTRCRGWFSDAGSWYGFTIPQKDKWINGFCGPFHLDKRQWASEALLKVNFANEDKSAVYIPDSTSYFPGELYMAASSSMGQIIQRLVFIDKSTAILSCRSGLNNSLHFHGEVLAGDITCSVEKNRLVLTWPDGEGLALTFSPEAGILMDGNKYEVLSAVSGETHVVISFFENKLSQLPTLQKATTVQALPELYKEQAANRWDSYLTHVLREDMPAGYNRIAAKAVVTLMSNWKSARGDLYHDGVVPSHAVGYFMGFWGWDSWKHAVALSRFAPELAKNQVRAMFDYQTPEGMVIDCIYSDAAENNARDSKPPLAAWAVSEIYKHTGDSAFVKEIYPKLLSYYQWWFTHRDHNRNGICEFGSCDGTLEAAAWESGMDNAIRFDEAKMVKNSEGAWSFNQESVDLNAFLALEHQLLSQLAPIAGCTFDEPNRSASTADYFFVEDRGFFFDKRLDGTFVLEEGTEACIPLWAGIASQEQADAVVRLFTDTTKFATYIPFPTIAADNPKFMPAGYWRGPIWLDQVYFGISGIRKYGYHKEADTFTDQIFTRLQGLTEDAPIHENYDTHNGARLKAPHFSWSAAHLLLLYEAYNK